MSEFPSQPEITPEVRLARMQELLGTLLASDFGDTEQMHEFMNLYGVHTNELLGDDSAYLAFLKSLDQPGLQFSEGTFDRIVYRYDDLVEGTGYLTGVY